MSIIIIDFSIKLVYMEFREILRDFLAEREMTQVEFAEKIGVKQSQVSEWLKGKSNPGYVNIKNMSLKFGVSADYWLGIEGIK